MKQNEDLRELMILAQAGNFDDLYWQLMTDAAVAVHQHMEELEDDKDALLTVVGAGKSLRQYAAYWAQRYPSSPASEIIDRYDKAFAALPEYLTHEHDWIDPTNEYVSGGAICLGCGDIRAETPEQLRRDK